ncbi:MAG: translocation/assembly module TamB domain-containing protein [Acidobacteriota bacterium]|nr:translocation/assembly module TamB domain-containing protein [Acidobacteriota bacterium]
MHGTPEASGSPPDDPRSRDRGTGALRILRRAAQVVAILGTLLVGALALALIVSQTPWFKDWLRRYVVRESKQYVNGDLTIGGLGGNLLFGVDLTDVAIDVSGERVVAVRAIELDYSIYELITRGLVLSEIKIDQPVLRLRRDAQGWNLADLVKRDAKEADREGPRRPISLPTIIVSDAAVSIDDRTANPAVILPRRVEDLDVRMAFEYEPVHYTLTVEHVSFRGTSPALTVGSLSGTLSLRDDNLYVERLSLKTAETSLNIDGVVEEYLSTPALNITTTGNISLPEIGRIVPAAAGYNLHPAIDIKAKGPAQKLALNLDVQSEAGTIKGQVLANVQAPDLGVRGDVDVENLNLAPLLKDPAQKSDLTGHAQLDVVMKSTPAGAPAADRLAGTFSFAGPRVVAAGYEARNVQVSGKLDGPRITIDGRAGAYGGTATARGFIVTPAPGRPLAFDLRGRAERLDLRQLPAATGAPQIATNLSVAEYHVTGAGQAISGTAALNESSVEGATIGGGTIATFDLTAKAISYTARGSVTGLDLDRVAGALEVDALAKPAYDSRINGTFDVAGSLPRTPPGPRGGKPPVPSTAGMKLDATGTFTDSALLGGRLPQLSFEAHLDGGALAGRAEGTFEGFNPAELAGRKDFEGKVTGTLDAGFSVRDINAPITPEAITAEGQLQLTDSTVGGLRIDSAAVDGRYAAQIGDITAISVTGPDVKVNASGRLALDRTTESALKYHVEAVNIAELARLAGQTGFAGAAVFDGTVSGNASTLKTEGTLDGSNLAYGENGALDLNSRYSVSVPELQFAKARVEATSEATFVKAAGMELNSVTATTVYDQGRIDFTTHVKEKTRELDATGQLVLHADHQEVHLPDLAIRTQGVEWRTASGSDATVKYGGERLQLEGVRLVSGDQSLDLTGGIAIGDKPSADAIEVQARNVDLQQIETLMLLDRGLTGRLTADARISGSTGAPTIDGTVSIDNGGFETYHYDSLKVKVDYAGNRIGLDAALQQSPTEAITAKGSVTTALFQARPAGGHVEPAAGDEIDLQIKSNALGLGVLQGVTTLLTNVAGTLEADIHVGGSGQDPHLRGFIDIKNGAFDIPATGGAFTGLTTRIDLEPERMRIQKFQLLDHHGEKLTVEGELAVHERQLGGVNITIASDNFELLDNELGDIQVQTALTITGEVRRPRIVGDVRLDAARVEVDRVLQLFYNPYSVDSLPEVVSAERQVEGSGSAEEAMRTALTAANQPATPATEDGAAPPPPAGAFEAVAMDIRVVVPDNLVLRGKDIRPGGPTGTALGNLNITVGGDMRIRKDPGGQVAPVGTVNTIRGTYEFQGRRFDLVRGGTLRFVGSPTINPILDVSATRTIPNTGVEARVHITGTAQAPQLELTSNPPLEESDILALIVFNRPVNELGTGERSSLAATAGGIATGFIAAPLGESIGRALDLDLFEITTTTESGELGAGLTLGQQLGERAFFRLRQQFGAQSTTEVELEYQLARFLRAQASAAPETSGAGNRINQRRVERAGIDLIFFFSY